MSDTPPNPPTPDIDETIDAQGEPVVVRRKQGFWARLGGGGLMVSLMIHFFLVVVAVFWVISTWTDSTKHEPTQFATGAGGGNDGDRAKIYQHRLQQKNMKSLAKSTPRLTSKNPNSSISLPDIPNVSTSSMISGATLGGSSKGFGGGSGGGIGSGQGIGVGNGKNMISKFKPVMGAKVQANKLAVFLDASQSMVPYLERVKKEICDQFPDADIFYSNGIYVNVKDGVVYGGAKYKGPMDRYKSSDQWATDSDKLTSAGKRLFKNYAANFQHGSIGAWIDILRSQKEYDALIVFSDFQDGVSQYRSPNKPDKNSRIDLRNDIMIYNDSYIASKKLDKDDRTEPEKNWESDWIKSFTSAKNSNGQGPKLYLFSIRFEPQPIFSKCVEASGGQIKMVQWLRSGGQPPADDNNDSIKVKKSSTGTPASSGR